MGSVAIHRGSGKGGSDDRPRDRSIGGGGRALKALAAYPGQPNSMHLREAEEPYVSDIPEGRGVLVRVLRVGVDGTR
jgi:hypothetical protein